MVNQTQYDAPFGAEPSGVATSGRLDGGGYDPIPPGLNDMDPGPVLATFLSSIDVAKVSGFDQIVVLKAHDRMASHYGAARYRDIAAVVNNYATVEGCSDVDAGDAAAAEIRGALRLTRRTADIEVLFARDLETRLPRLASMLASGVIDVRRSKTIERSTMHLSDTTAQAVLDAVAQDAPDLTTGQLAARIRRLCIEVDPDDAKDRYTAAYTERRIVTQLTDAGTVNLMGYDLAPDHVAVIMNRVNQIAKKLHGTNSETRTMDQLRADICLDLLNGITPTTEAPANSGVIDLVVDIDTLAGLNNEPGELGGYGPVIADIARQIADNHRNAQWRISARHPQTGDHIHIGTTSQRPTPTQRRRIETRNRTCVFPGCRIPATICDLDHTTAIQNRGETCDCNLAPLCRHDHSIKHKHGWTYQQLPDGRHQWLTPHGHTYTTPTKQAPP